MPEETTDAYNMSEHPAVMGKEEALRLYRTLKAPMDKRGWVDWCCDGCGRSVSREPKPVERVWFYRCVRERTPGLTPARQDYLQKGRGFLCALCRKSERICGISRCRKSYYLIGQVERKGRVPQGFALEGFEEGECPSCYGESMSNRRCGKDGGGVLIRYGKRGRAERISDVEFRTQEVKIVRPPRVAMQMIVNRLEGLWRTRYVLTGNPRDVALEAQVRQELMTWKPATEGGGSDREWADQLLTRLYKSFGIKKDESVNERSDTWKYTVGQAVSDVFGNANLKTAHSVGVCFRSDWESDREEFYNDSSCWWKEYSQSRCAMYALSGTAMILHGAWIGDLLGRSMVVPIGNDLVCFNWYGGGGRCSALYHAAVLEALTGGVSRPCYIADFHGYVNSHYVFAIESPAKARARKSVDANRLTQYNLFVTGKCGCYYKMQATEVVVDLPSISEVTL